MKGISRFEVLVWDIDSEDARVNEFFDVLSTVARDLLPVGCGVQVVTECHDATPVADLLEQIRQLGVEILDLQATAEAALSRADHWHELADDSVAVTNRLVQLLMGLGVNAETIDEVLLG